VKEIEKGLKKRGRGKKCVCKIETDGEIKRKREREKEREIKNEKLQEGMREWKTFAGNLKSIRNDIYSTGRQGSNHQYSARSSHRHRRTTASEGRNSPTE